MSWVLSICMQCNAFTLMHTTWLWRLITYSTKDTKLLRTVFYLEQFAIHYSPKSPWLILMLKAKRVSLSQNHNRLGYCLRRRKYNLRKSTKINNNIPKTFSNSLKWQWYTKINLKNHLPMLRKRRSRPYDAENPLVVNFSGFEDALSWIYRLLQIALINFEGSSGRGYKKSWRLQILFRTHEESVKLFRTQVIRWFQKRT